MKELLCIIQVYNQHLFLNLRWWKQKRWANVKCDFNIWVGQSIKKKSFGMFLQWLEPTIVVRGRITSEYMISVCVCVYVCQNQFGKKVTVQKKPTCITTSLLRISYRDKKKWHTSTFPNSVHTLMHLEFPPEDNSGLEGIWANGFNILNKEPRVHLTFIYKLET